MILTCTTQDKETDIMARQDPPAHCAICNVELHYQQYLMFFWWPMCETHRIAARGLLEWVERMCDRVYSEQEEMKLAQEVIHYMREQEEEIH